MVNEEGRKKDNSGKKAIAVAAFIAIAIIFGYTLGVWTEKASNAMMLNAIFKNADITINANATEIAQESNKTLYPMLSLFTRIMINGTVMEVASEFEGCKKIPYPEDDSLYLIDCSGKKNQTEKVTQCRQPNDCFKNATATNCHRDNWNCNWCCGNLCNLASCSNYSSSFYNYSAEQN